MIISVVKSFSFFFLKEEQNQLVFLSIKFPSFTQVLRNVMLCFLVLSKNYFQFFRS